MPAMNTNSQAPTRNSQLAQVTGYFEIQIYFCIPDFFFFLMHWQINQSWKEQQHLKEHSTNVGCSKELQLTQVWKSLERRVLLKLF